MERWVASHRSGRREDGGGPGLADRMIRQTIARCGAKSELAASDWAAFASVLASITARNGGAEAGRVILRASGSSGDLVSRQNGRRAVRFRSSDMRRWLTRFSV